MSDKIPTSSRLDSLSRRAPTTSVSSAKPGLKFKPKVVARRSKEERDANAPTDAPEVTKRNPHANRGGTRGRGNANRGGRGGRALAGTHLVQTGPLASGNVLNESTQPLNRSHSASPTPDYLSNLMKRDTTTRESSVPLDSDDEDLENLTKINMSKDYNFTAEESELFPVRAPRSQHIDISESHEPHGRSRSDTPGSESVTSGDVDMDDTLPTSVKDEETETDLNSLLNKKDAELHKKLHGLQLDSINLAQDDGIQTPEQEIEDHKAIIKQLLDTDNKDDEFLFFQLPRVLPEFATTKPQLSADIPVKDEQTNDKEVLEEKQEIEGTIGKLRVHKSGRVTMKIGNVVLDVGRGAQTKFLQEVVLIEKDEEKRTSFLLGHIQDKVVATPRFGERH